MAFWEADFWDSDFWDSDFWADGGGGVAAIATCAAGAGGPLLWQHDFGGSGSGYPSNSNDLVGQSFSTEGMLLITGFCLTMDRTGTPTGNVLVNVRAHTGTYGTSSVPTGSVLVASLEYDIAAVAATPTAYWLPLTTSLPVAAAYYTVEIDLTGITGDGSNYINVYSRLGGSYGPGGNMFYDSGAGYNAVSSADLFLRVYGTGAAPSTLLQLYLGMGM